MKEIKETRKKINDIDNKIAELFELRMDQAKEVAEYKKATGMPIEDRLRETEVIENNCNLIKNSEYLPYYTDFIKATMKISKAYQKNLLGDMSIAINGTKGAFADIAAERILNGSSHKFYPDFTSAFAAAESGECDCAFLPIENSFGGDVGAVLDLAFFGNLYINGIFELDIRENLVGLKTATAEDIKTVLSHPQALIQCGKFIEESGFKTVDTSSTSAAVQIVKQKNDKSLGAIASKDAALDAGLKIIKENVNTSGSNITRFAVFSRARKEKSLKDNRFIVMFTVKNEAGALSKAMSVIAKRGFNLVDLKSRPTRIENWEHYFYAEGEGNIYSENGQKMLEELKNACENLKVAGSFEKGMKA